MSLSSNISENEVIEVFTILSSLEVLAVKLAAEKMDQETQLDIGPKNRRINGLEGTSGRKL